MTREALCRKVKTDLWELANAWKPQRVADNFLEGRKEVAGEPSKREDRDGCHPEHEFQCLSLHLGHRPAAGSTEGLCFLAQDPVIGNWTTYEHRQYADVVCTLQTDIECMAIEILVLVGL